MINLLSKKQPDVLYAFYDLAVSPPSFDIVTFLLFAEIERKKVNCDSMHVIIVPGSTEGFRTYDLELYHKTGEVGYNVDFMRWRLRNILVPCCWLIPSCREVTVCASRRETQAFQVSLARHIFPEGYTVHFTKAHYNLRNITQQASLPTIQATPQALSFVREWIRLKSGGRKVIAISLRECTNQQDRNSDLGSWGKFARSLDQSVYCPIVIRDTEAVFKPLPAELAGLAIFPEPSWNIELRAALHELSYLNMFVNNGPAVLSIYNHRSPYLIFKIITSSCEVTTEEFFYSGGLTPGSQFKFATPFQRLIWEDDKLEVIQKAFKDMCDRIGF